jgi:hypothetical protein
VTVDEIIDYVRNIHNEASAQTPFWTDRELYALITVKCNQVLGQIGLIEGTDTSISTVAGTYAYDIPDGYTRLRRLWYDGRPLKYVGFRPFESRRPTGVATNGLPREFTIWDDQILLSPPPSEVKTLTIYGEKMQATITNGVTEPSIPKVFHSCLCDGVLAEMYAKDENQAFAQMYEERWVKLHIPAMKEYVKRRRRRGMPSVVVDTDSALETEFGVI